MENGLLVCFLLLVFSSHFSFLHGANNRVSSDHHDMINLSKVTQISSLPRAFIYHGFLSDEECDHLIGLTKDKLQRSTVMNDVTGEISVGQERTSSDLFLRKQQNLPTLINFVLKDEVVSRIERRISAWTFLPEENGESIQILRYEKGEKFDPHFDSFSQKYNSTVGGHRYATLLMYLSDVKKGGETVFIDAEGKHSQEKDDTWSDCAKKGYAVKPKKGDTLLFFSLHPNATLDTHSMHGGCPVIEGVKWSATKWIHVRPYRLSPEERLVNGKCIDKNQLCPLWAKSGECEKNPEYMIGSDISVGSCIRSCKVCVSSKEEEGEGERLRISDCVDMDERCKQWSANGECEKNPAFMVGNINGSHGTCRRSCKLCES